MSNDGVKGFVSFGISRVIFLGFFTEFLLVGSTRGSSGRKSGIWGQTQAQKGDRGSRKVVVVVVTGVRLFVERSKRRVSRY